MRTHSQQPMLSLRRASGAKQQRVGVHRRARRMLLDATGGGIAIHLHARREVRLRLHVVAALARQLRQHHQLGQHHQLDRAMPMPDE